jgi:transposase
VIEMSQSKSLVAAMVPGIERQLLKKLDAAEDSLFKLLHRWRQEAERAGHSIKRIVVAYEAGRDGFWLARWLRVRGFEAYVIHPTSVAVSHEHRRAKTDRLDTELLLRAPCLGGCSRAYQRLRDDSAKCIRDFFQRRD